MQDDTDLLQIPREARPTYTMAEIVQYVRDQIVNDVREQVGPDSPLHDRISALAEHVNRLEARVAELEGKE